MSSSSLKWQCQYCGLINFRNIVCSACFSVSPFEHRNRVVNDCKNILKQHDQLHILDHIQHIINPINLNKLLKQIYNIDFSYINKLYKIAISEEKERTRGPAKVSAASPLV